MFWSLNYIDIRSIGPRKGTQATPIQEHEATAIPGYLHLLRPCMRNNQNQRHLYLLRNISWPDYWANKGTYHSDPPHSWRKSTPLALTSLPLKVVIVALFQLCFPSPSSSLFSYSFCTSTTTSVLPSDEGKPEESQLSLLLQLKYCLDRGQTFPRSLTYM